MYIQLAIETEFEVKKLSDLPKLKTLMEHLKMKINKSELARELGVDRRTIDKYLNGFTPSKNKKKASKIDEFYEVISLLLSVESKQVFYYKRILWQYLKDNHGLECRQSTFRAYLQRTPEFNAYFKEGKRTIPIESSARFETPPWEQAQLDWKENLPYETKDGEIVYINVAVLFFFMNEAFETFGGVPKVIVTDNMKTVMDDSRTRYSKGKVNQKFAQFAQDYGFKVHPCIAGKPNTKGKVEAPMKYLDEIHAYQGKFNLEELHRFVQQLCERINQSFHQGTHKIPVFALKQEKNLLLPLPRQQIRDSYQINHTLVKVNPSNMVPYKGNHYSVPAKYQGKTVGLQVYDDQLYVYDNTELLVQHQISQSVLNYKQAHYQESLGQAIPHYPNIEELAKGNLVAIGEVYKHD